MTKAIHIYSFDVKTKKEDYWYYCERVVNITGKCPVLPDRCSITDAGQHVPNENLRRFDE